VSYVYAGKEKMLATLQKLHLQASHHHHKSRHLMNFHLSLKENMRWKQELSQCRGNMSAEYDRAYDTLLSDHSVTPGSPVGGLLRALVVLDAGLYHWIQKCNCHQEVEGPRGNIHLEEAWGILIQLMKTFHWSKK